MEVLESCAAQSVKRLFASIDGRTSPKRILRGVPAAIVASGEGYTLGKALEHMIYTKHYASSGDMKLIFCAFNKAHPHDTDTYIQVALQDDVPNKVAAISSMAISAAKDIIAIFENIKEQFESEP